MSDVLGSNFRESNRLRILEVLLRHPSRSRAELGRSLGLSRATVTAVLSELERAGMVEQQSDGLTDERRKAIGRPPLQVSLAPRAACAVGLDFGHRHVRAAVCDLGGAIIAQRWAESRVDEDPLGSFDLARDLAMASLAEANVAFDDVIGAGVGMAAPVDGRRGAVHTDGLLPDWAGLDPARELESRLEMPVQVENDANAGAMGEHLFGAGRGVSDMLYVRLSAGVGLGLILRDQPYRGVAGVAGEIGHTEAVSNGEICRCGNRGCLETIVSPVALADLLERSRGEPTSVARMLDLVRAGDRGAQRVVSDAGQAIGAALAAAVNLLNPSLVIIGGELAEAGEVLLTPIRAAITRSAIAPAAASMRVVAGDLGSRAEVLGAATIQLARAPEALANRLVAA
ncbi:ROK family transcriptional regulator [Solirubrobacter ginsenosidimutans]|uniref:ROK family transcriptional regulator n=1 Tax=Solirubrobacter ginsenosidimutans TaxID=490573 RepID=A0A9X3N3Q6_9ACTN|nr:ROK family transcriptional regulator [Solirubrobacter ginsenosidimutans]MDA0166430.1 ROK family transcriptional regulator [Solirubrobacter ginsenosidimutans]